VIEAFPSATELATLLEALVPIAVAPVANALLLTPKAMAPVWFAIVPLLPIAIEFVPLAVV
jgi:hypothetical protein